ncbi:hypothetical protein BCR37DRAFT_390500 [Protomyces lactucae-debilis]|uniref:Small RNA 2'-O-methyltransferase n=1 Tax=Protomyces lactucae-debilis TaxID=2754530 RepID=A0A1Y2FVF1_PROLT|nr:uncharacterized protein BCR37DRAFT_390500 [Protomyces lactucae-debilis]ORY88003.1 hypothetical protein BCR37DRAFT_390500 [Protomyces lactucae-debilis]
MQDGDHTDEAQQLEVRFDPPAHLQRRAAVYAHLKQHAPRTLLDIGCGEGALLAHLIKGDDQVPLEVLHGFDVDAEVLASIRLSTDDEDLRWRRLEANIFLGGVQDIGRPLLQSYDAVAAIEVLEHLDPPDIAALGQVLYKLAPRVFYVTTPNRDFNQVFERICSPAQFHRPCIPYAMRHDDHRFELSRQEFCAWAHSIIEGLPYKVSFQGIGSVGSAFAGQDWLPLFPEDTADIFGCSTQMAVFERTEHFDAVPIASASMKLVQTIVFPFSTEDGYPPTETAIKELVAYTALYFRPLYENTYAAAAEEVVTVSLLHLYEVSYALQRICRFTLHVFQTAMSKLAGQTWAGEDKLLLQVQVDSENVCYTYNTQACMQPVMEDPGEEDGAARWMQDGAKFDQNLNDRDDEWET